MHRSRRPRALVLTLAIALAPTLGACGESGPRDLAPPSRDTPPSGTRTVTCELATDDAPLTFSFTLGDDYAPDAGLVDEGCAWRRPAPPPAEEPRGNPVDEPTADAVVVAWVGEESLRDVRDRQEPFVSEDGDDALSDLRLSEDVVVFGETVGDRLRWDCFCDGLPSATYLSQAAGVRLTWSGPVVLQDQIEDEVRTALVSAGAG